MLAGDTDRVNKRTTVLVWVVVVAVAAAAVWFGVGFLRDRRAATSTTATQERTDGESLTAVPRAGQQAAAAAAGSSVTRTAGNQPSAPSISRPGQETAADATMATTLVLADGEVLVSYPAGFGLAVTQEQLHVSSQIPPCDLGFDYCIYLDSGEFEGTNFSSAGLRIGPRDDLTNEADCMLTQPSGYADLVPVVAGASDFATTMFRGLDQGAAGHFSQGSLGRLYYDSVCYEFATRVAQAQFGNFARGAVEEFEAADLEATDARLMGVLDSVTLPDGRSGLWARKVPTEPVAAGAATVEGAGEGSEAGAESGASY